MRHRLLAPALALCVAGVVSCSDAGSGAGARVTVRDSAGITVVENALSPAEAGTAYRLSEEPEVDIGRVRGPPEYRLHRVYGATRLSDGRIVVLDNGSLQVRFYSPEGKFLRAVGGEGEGPGEFASLWALFRLRKDSIVVWDHDLQRITVFTADGDYARSGRLEPPFVNEPHPYVVFRDGSLFYSYEQRHSPENGCTTERVLLVRYGPSGVGRDTLGEVESGRYCRATRTFLTRPDFEAYARVDASPRRVYVATGEERAVRVLEPDGRLERLVRWGGQREPVTEADVEAYREWQLARYDRSPRLEKRIRRGQEVRPTAEYFPTLRALKAADTGHLWVRLYGRPPFEGPERWMVFDPDGRLLGTVQVPRALEIHQIGKDYVLGVFEGELDVEHVRLYALVEASSS